MLRLETVEDFERVRKALQDPRSKLSEYCLVNCGFCDFCKTLTVYDFYRERNHANGHLVCHGCHNKFPQDDFRCFGFSHSLDENTIKHFSYRIDDDLDVCPINGVWRDVFSRANQKKVFWEQLEKKIADFKSQQRTLAGRVRRLAKLRG